MNESNLNEAPVLTIKDKMIQEIKQKTKNVLNKYFQGREYEKENVGQWKDYTMEELTDFLQHNYKEYGFCLFIIIIKRGSMSTNANGIARQNTDGFFVESLETKTMYVGIRIRFYKLYQTNINYLDSYNDKLLMKMNNILNSKLEGKNYSNDFGSAKTEEIVIELQKYLLIQESKPCSYQICSILSKPYDYQFYYKNINLNYLPLIASYSNDSLYSFIILFILDN